MNLKNSKRNSQLSDNEEDDEDKFSDDSLEDTSLPPPAPPPIVVPPPPSLSAPVTPSKRHSIAWEVNLDDLCSNGNGGGFTTKVEFKFFMLSYKGFFFLRIHINIKLMDGYVNLCCFGRESRNLFLALVGDQNRSFS